jgi:hypothetical protein
MIILSHCLQKFEVHSTYPEVITTPQIMEEFTCQVCGKKHDVPAC